MEERIAVRANEVQVELITFHDCIHVHFLPWNNQSIDMTSR